jgi:hypothetical protein
MATKKKPVERMPTNVERFGGVISVPKRPAAPRSPTPMPDVVTAPGGAAKPGRRVGKNTSPGTPRKVGSYAPVMPTQAKKKAPAKRK